MCIFFIETPYVMLIRIINPVNFKYLMKLKAQRFAVVSLFAITMGFLEAIVVVYLREIFYPAGFQFPLVTIPPELFNIELVREVTTIIMLLCIGFLAGRSNSEKFAWFIFAFGVWDIFYYVALKLTLGWPVSLMTWDILYLIPVTWIGPVLAPVICSLTMIFLALIIIFFENNGHRVHFGKYSGTLFVFGSIIIFFSFIESYLLLLYFEGFFNLFNNTFNQADLEKAISTFVPEQFNWLLFWIGEFFILGGIFHIFLQSMRRYQKKYKIV